MFVFNPLSILSITYTFYASYQYIRCRDTMSGYEPEADAGLIEYPNVVETMKAMMCVKHNVVFSLRRGSFSRTRRDWEP